MAMEPDEPLTFFIWLKKVCWTRQYHTYANTLSRVKISITKSPGQTPNNRIEKDGF